MNYRTGLFGEYVGSFYNESIALSEGDQKTNARYIFSFLTNEGWTPQSISALLGNMQAESSINPGRWQSDDVGNMSMGYGLVQWTPATKYLNWCSERSFADPSEMDANLSRIIYEVVNGLQWIKTSRYNFSFEEFTKSSKPPSELAKAFLLNYERPADQSTAVQKLRGSNADNWYRFITGLEPEQPKKQKKKGYNFILFNRQRKLYNNGIKRHHS